MSSKLQHAQDFDGWLHWMVTDRCNLYCAYHDVPGKECAELSEINIPALMKTLDAVKKVFKMSFTGGGEPFLVPNIVEACVELTKKHYVSFSSNLTSGKIPDFCKRVSPKYVLYIIASLHIKELERLDLMDRYVSNFLLCKKKGLKSLPGKWHIPPF